MIMATLPNYRQDILDNPVQRAERTHLLQGGMSWFWRAIYASTILAILAPILWGFGVYFHSTLEISLGLLVLINIVMIFVVEMRVMSHAAESIRREFQGKTWDLLILTGVDTWRLILGKWLGSIRGNWREIAYLYVLRVSTFIWGMVALLLQEDGFAAWRYYRDDVIPAQLMDIRFDAQALIVGASIMALFLVLEMMLVSSLPIALSLFRQTRKAATWIALGLRIGIPLALGLIIIWTSIRLQPTLGTVKQEYSYATYIHYSQEVNIGIGSMATVLGDNGFAWSLLSMDSTVSTSPLNKSLFYLTQLLGIGLYLLWIWVMLRLAHYGAGQHNVSAPGYVPKAKPKRLIQAEHSPTDKPSTPTITQPKPRSPRDTNLLGIQNPALYRCEVLRYADAQLEIAVYRITERSPQFTLRFTGVSFFTGVMNWTNAKFEQLEANHLRQYATTQKLDADTLPIGSTLYVVKSQGNRTRILATDVQIEVVKVMPV